MSYSTSTHRPPIHHAKTIFTQESKIQTESRSTRQTKPQKPKIFSEEKKHKPVQSSEFHSLRDHERGVYFASPRIKINQDQQSPKPEPHIYSLNVPRSYDRKTAQKRRTLKQQLPLPKEQKASMRMASHGPLEKTNKFLQSPASINKSLFAEDSFSILAESPLKGALTPQHRKLMSYCDQDSLIEPAKIRHFPDRPKGPESGVSIGANLGEDSMACGKEDLFLDESQADVPTASSVSSWGVTTTHMEELTQELNKQRNLLSRQPSYADKGEEEQKCKTVNCMTTTPHNLSCERSQIRIFKNESPSKIRNKKSSKKLTSPSLCVKVEQPPFEELLEPFYPTRLMRQLENVQERSKMQSLALEKQRQQSPEDMGYNVLDDMLPVFDQEFDLELEENLITEMLDPQIQVKIFMKKSQTKLRNSRAVSGVTPPEGDTHSSLNLSIQEVRRVQKCFQGFCDEYGNFHEGRREKVLLNAVQERKRVQEELGFFDRRKLVQNYENTRKAFQIAHDILVSIAEYEYQKWIYNMHKLDPSIVASQFERILAIQENDLMPLQEFSSALCLQER